MNTLKVTNTGRQPFILNLARGVDYGDKFLPTRIPYDVAETDKDGLVVGIKKRTLAQPPSISWLPGETREDIPPAARMLEDFRKAEAAGILRLV